MLLKIGELARRTGLTVRTLHHYDAIGLLRPSARTEAGYRLYDREDISRLHRIQALRRLDLPLNEIAAILARGGAELPDVIRQQMTQLEREIARAARLRDRLGRLLEDLAAAVEPDLDGWLGTLEMMSIMDKYFTPEEVAMLDAARERSQNNGRQEEGDMVPAVRALMDAGVPPSDAQAQALARRWLAYVEKHMAGSARLTAKLDAMHRNEPTVQALTGVDGDMIDYMVAAAAHVRLALYARHLTPAQVETIRASYLAHFKGFPGLTMALRGALEQGLPVSAPEVQALCARWKVQFRATFGDDPDIHARIRHAHLTDPEVVAGTGMDQALRDYLNAGMALINTDHGEPR